jgi:hypothetical protein
VNAEHCKGSNDFASSVRKLFSIVKGNVLSGCHPDIRLRSNILDKIPYRSEATWLAAYATVETDSHHFG